MQRVLSFCLGWLAGKPKFARSLLTGDRASPADSTERAQDGLSSPPLPPPLPQNDLANPQPFPQEGEPSEAPSAPKEEKPSSPLLPGERGSPAAPSPCRKGQSQSSVPGASLPSDSRSSLSSRCPGSSDHLAQSLPAGGTFGGSSRAASEELRPGAAQGPPEDAAPNQLLLCRCGRVPPDRLFSDHVPQAAARKGTSGSFTSKASAKSESSSTVSCEEAPGEPSDSSWQRYQVVLLPPSPLESIQRSTKMQRATPEHPLERGELLREGFQVAMDGRQNARSGMEASMRSIPGVYVRPFPANGEVSPSGSTIGRPFGCSSSSLPEAPRSESHDRLKAKLATPETYRSVDRGSVVKPSAGSGSWCKCSQEILLHRMGEGASYRARRGTF